MVEKRIRNMNFGIQFINKTNAMHNSKTETSYIHVHIFNIQIAQHSLNTFTDLH